MTAYAQGIQAYQNGLDSDSNPFARNKGESTNHDRVAWFNGWYDAWRITKYGLNEDEQMPECLVF